MILPDVNVLIYAFRADLLQHATCRRWLVDVVSGDSRFGLSPLVLAAVVRITTNRRVFKVPSVPEEAFEFCASLLRQPHCQLVEPGERHWDIFRRLCITSDTRGARVSDAWFAALAMEWGCEWITLDRDYARFPGLTWRSPVDAGPAA
jgi:toxin-antitoxin system PIN domain toxin